MRGASKLIMFPVVADYTTLGGLSATSHRSTRKG